jgi:PAS domain S-box-containing protein
MQPTPTRFDSRSLFSPEHSAIWLVALVGLTLSWAALWIIQEQLEVHTRQDFEWVSHNRVRALKHGIERDLEAVTVVRDLYRGSEEVTAEEFRVFGSALLERYRGIQALLWVPRVPRATRAAYEDASGLAIHSIASEELESSAEPAEYFPVTYLIAREGCEFIPGADLGSDPGYASVLRRARDTGTMAASGRIAFADGDKGTEYGFMAAVPVFPNPTTAAPQDQTDREISGFVVGLFRLRGLTDAAVALLEPRGVEILIRDESAPPGERYLHFYDSRLAPRTISEAGDGETWSSEAQSTYTERIPVADREWSVICGRIPQFRSAEAFREGPWVVLGAGLLFTVLLSFYLLRIKENVRERLMMEQRLIESEELFRQMTETVDEVFWATSADGSKLLYLSPAYERIFGVTVPQQDRRATISDAISEQDRASLLQAFARVRADGESAEVVHTVTRPDGITRWVRTRGFPVSNESGKVYRIVGFLEDITERKLADEALRESEAKLRDMFQQSPDIIMTVDQGGKILLMNRSVPVLPADRAVGRNSLALVPAGFRKWYRKALKKVFRKAKTQKFQYATDDSQLWEGRIVPIQSNGSVTAAMVVATDVTEKRNLEQQALRNARLASIGVLAAGVAHEINNPNNSIAFNASLVSRAWQDVTPILRDYADEHGDFSLGGISFSEANETFPELLSEISRNSTRIKRIVENLKHMARQDTGRLTERVDIQQVLEATMMVLHNQIQKHTDACILEVPDNLPSVKGSSQQLEQVFINILLNALQSLPDRRRGVCVRAGLSEARDQLEITVVDQGEGIPERDLGRLTEPFFTTRSDTGGTGLGLSITRSIIEKHGGSLRFESELDKGTTVTIKLPVTLSV